MSPQDRFADLVTGGRALAPLLEMHRDAADTVVLAIVRGGVPASLEVARHLRLPLDVILRRNLLVIETEAVGVTNIAGTLYLEPRIPAIPPTPSTPLDHFLTDALRDMEQRIHLCRGDRPPLDLRGKTAIVVDNGIRTGGTMRMAVTATRALGASRIIAASPVGAPNTRDSIAEVADEVVCPRWMPLGNVAMGYVGFDVPADEQVRELVFGS